MASNWFLQLDNWNPQLLREIKGRCTVLNLCFVTGLSLLAQGLILVGRYRLSGIYLPLVPMDEPDITWISLTDWRLLCFDIFNTLTWSFFPVLLILSNYLLMRNIAWEERRGTFTFLRLSPESSRTILIGKLLGVPILLYLTICLAVPLHLWTAFQARLPIVEVLSLYAFSAVAYLVVYLFSLHYSLGWRAKAKSWYVLVPAFGAYLLWLSLLVPWSRMVRETIQRPSVLAQSSFYDQAEIHTGILLFVILSVCGYLCWRECLQRFRHPP